MIQLFLSSLLSVKQLCRLGRHVPITNILRDGILKVGKKKAEKLANTETDRWFELIGDSATATLIKLYSQVILMVGLFLFQTFFYQRYYNRFMK